MSKLNQVSSETAEEESYVIDHVCATCIHSDVCDDTFSNDDFYAKCPLIMED